MVGGQDVQDVLNRGEGGQFRWSETDPESLVEHRHQNELAKGIPCRDVPAERRAGHHRLLEDLGDPCECLVKRQRAVGAWIGKRHREEITGRLRPRYCAEYPPSTTRSVPVIHAVPGASRNTAARATSTGAPGPSGCLRSRSATCSGVNMARAVSVIGVRTRPGEI